MTQARKRQVDLAQTPYYHCMTRCVRRAFLCGGDGDRNFDHRRGWVVNRLKFLSSIFAIDVCAYAIMSNHSHVVLRVDTDRVKAWSDREVAERWGRLYGLPNPVCAWFNGETLDDADSALVAEKLAIWRGRLSDISWYMKGLNEYIARKANAEDQCTGHFWEARFKSQALLSTTALLTCMCYVDLNPIRAGMARTPELSDFTSIKERLEEWAEHKRIVDDVAAPPPLPSWLASFQQPGSWPEGDGPEPLPYSFVEYAQLVDWAGRAVRSDKRGFIPPDTPALFDRMSITPVGLAGFVGRSNKYSAIGPKERLRAFAAALDKVFFRGGRELGALFKPDG